MADSGYRRAIPGYEGLYEASADGRIFSLARTVRRPRRSGVVYTAQAERELKQYADRYGYLHVGLSKDGKVKGYGVHRLICRAFLGPPPAEGMHAAHKDGDKQNNRKTNLKWATVAENNEDRRAHGVHPMGNTLPHAKLTPGKVKDIVARSRQGQSNIEIARIYGVTDAAISKVLRGKSWRHVTGLPRLNATRPADLMGRGV